MARHDGRGDNVLRPVKLTTDYLKNPRASVMIDIGETRVLCTASVEERVPSFLKGTNEGWVTAEYSMIPGATNTRTQREVTRGRPSGRSLEIQRLIGRSLRSVVDRTVLGERTIWIDCDVLQADGGTRTASITGGFVALGQALARLREDKVIGAAPLTGMLAAISVGIVESRPALDLDYIEDSAAEVDMNVVRTDDGRYIELQGTAEQTPFPREQLDSLLNLADTGIDQLIDVQREALGPSLAQVLAKH